MTAKQFYDWQTSGGTDDVMRLVNILEKSDIAWCTIDGVAVNHWAKQPMVTQDVDFVVVSDAIDRTVTLLKEAGFHYEKFKWSVNFTGRSVVSIQLSTEEFYKDFPSRAVAADVFLRHCSPVTAVTTVACIVTQNKIFALPDSKLIGFRQYRLPDRKCASPGIIYPRTSPTHFLYTALSFINKKPTEAFRDVKIFRHGQASHLPSVGRLALQRRKACKETD